MVHSAYDSIELLSNSPAKIDVVESYGSRLLVGCSDGSLRIYVPESSVSDALPELSGDSKLLSEPYVHERTINGFAKKPIIAMEAFRSKELLFSLSEAISFHRLPTMETVAVISKAKGANVYSWDDCRGFLCFARHKRVSIFRGGGRGFVEVKEYGVPDTVKSVAWCGENICIGIRKEYMVLNTSSGALSEVFSSGRISPPLVVSLPSGGLLLSKNNSGVFVDQHGKLGQEGRVCWSEPPMKVAIDEPYAIGLNPRHVELMQIRSIRQPYRLIQTIVIRNVRHLMHSNGVILVSLDKSVYALFPVPLGAQIVQLTASGNFEEALALCELLPPEDSSLRSAKESAIHVRYAHYLFEMKAMKKLWSILWLFKWISHMCCHCFRLSLFPSQVCFLSRRG